MGYLRPERMEDALEALADGASVIAGGTDWYPAHGEAPLPDAILDVTALPGFSGVSRADDGWRIGAATTWTEIVKADLPPSFDGLKAAAREVGAIQIQNAGTVGGNLCNASPAADGVPPLLTLDAHVQLIGPDGVRGLPLSDFVTGVRQTALRPGELLQAIHIPDPGPAQGSFVKLGARKYLVISIAMVSALIRVEAGQIAAASVAVGACSAVACCLPKLEAALIGQPIANAADLIKPDHLAPLSPISDVRGSADYRLDASAELIRRAVLMAVSQEAVG